MIEYGILMENELFSLLELYQQLNSTDDTMGETTAKMFGMI